MRIPLFDEITLFFAIGHVKLLFVVTQSLAVAHDDGAVLLTEITVELVL